MCRKNQNHLQIVPCLITFFTVLIMFTQHWQQYRGDAFMVLAVTFQSQWALKKVSRWQTLCVGKRKINTQWCLHYLRAPRPMKEARVNCCWLDVSMHGWVSMQISLRGPQREKRKGWGHSHIAIWDQCQVFFCCGFRWLGSRLGI